MIPKDLFAQIEGTAFAARIGVVSTPKRFAEAVALEPESQRMLTHLVSPVAREQMRQHMRDLLSRSSEPGYAHPDDLALGVYQRLLETTDPDMAVETAKVLAHMPQLWWARLMARSTLAGVRDSTVNQAYDWVIDRELTHVARPISNAVSAHRNWSMRPARAPVKAHVSSSVATTVPSEMSCLPSSGMRLRTVGAAA